MTQLSDLSAREDPAAAGRATAWSERVRRTL